MGRPPCILITVHNYHASQLSLSIITHHNYHFQSSRITIIIDSHHIITKYTVILWHQITNRGSLPVPVLILLLIQYCSKELEKKTKKMPHFDHFPRPGEIDPYGNNTCQKRSFPNLYASYIAIQKQYGTSTRVYGSISPGRGKWSKCSIFF